VENFYEYSVGILRVVEENYFEWGAANNRNLSDFRVDFERACKHIGCWNRFLKQGEIERDGTVYRDNMLSNWQLNEMKNYLNGVKE